MTQNFLDKSLEKISNSFGLIEEDIDILMYELFLSSSEQFNKTKKLLINKTIPFIGNDLSSSDNVKISGIYIEDTRNNKRIYLTSVLDNDDFTNTNELEIVFEFIYLNNLNTKIEDKFESFFSSMLDINKYLIISKFISSYNNYKETKIFNPYQLAFSKGLMNNPLCKDYIENGDFGYVGHSMRTPELDKYLEKYFRDNNWNLDYLATWITSYGARRMCDELYNISDTDQAKIDKFSYEMTNIYNLGLIYSHPSHKGSLNDTIRLREELKDQLK